MNPTQRNSHPPYYYGERIATSEDPAMRDLNLCACVEPECAQPLALFGNELGPVDRDDFRNLAKGKKVERHDFALPYHAANCKWFSLEALRIPSHIISSLRA